MPRTDSATRAERERRVEFIERLDGDGTAEFIDGEIVVPPPVVKEHADAVLLLKQLIDTYAITYGLGYVGSRLLVRLRRNDFEPDVVFWRAATAADFTRKQLFFPAPDLAVEVLSPGTEGEDRGTKFDDYAANGVSEYWIVDADAEAIECYERGPDDAYTLRERVSGEATLRSSAVEGFAIPAAAAFDESANLQALWAMRPELS